MTTCASTEPCNRVKPWPLGLARSGVMGSQCCAEQAAAAWRGQRRRPQPFAAQSRQSTCSPTPPPRSEGSAAAASAHSDRPRPTHMASSLTAAQPLRLAAQRPFQPLRSQRAARMVVRAQVGGRCLAARHCSQPQRLQPRALLVSTIGQPGGEPRWGPGARSPLIERPSTQRRPGKLHPLPAGPAAAQRPRRGLRRPGGPARPDLWRGAGRRRRLCPAAVHQHRGAGAAAAGHPHLCGRRRHDGGPCCGGHQRRPARGHPVALL